MNISERCMSNEEVLKVAKIFLEKEKLTYQNSSYYFEKIDSKIFIYDKKRNTYIIEGEEVELLTIYNCIEKIDLDSKFEDLFNFLYFINGTYIYLAQKYYYEHIIINKYFNNYDLSETILDRIYILKNNKLVNITEEEFKIYYNDIPFSEARMKNGDDFIIILDKNFDFILFTSLSNIKLKGVISPPYYFYKGFNGLEVADITKISKLNFLKSIPDSNFFYEIEKNKLVIYEYAYDKLEYFSEIKIKESYSNISLGFINDKIKFNFTSRLNYEKNIEFYLILRNPKKLFLVFKYKKNNSSETITVNTTNGKERVFSSKEEPLNCNGRINNSIFDEKKGFIISETRKFMYYNGKEITLTNNYNYNMNYSQINNLIFLNNGIKVDDDLYITYKGEILPIKSFINNNTLILSIIKVKIKKGIYVSLEDDEYNFKKDIYYLNAERIDKNIEGYKSKLNKEILKEFIK